MHFLYMCYKLLVILPLCSCSVTRRWTPAGPQTSSSWLFKVSSVPVRTAAGDQVTGRKGAWSWNPANHVYDEELLAVFHSVMKLNIWARWNYLQEGFYFLFWWLFFRCQKIRKRLPGHRRRHRQQDGGTGEELLCELSAAVQPGRGAAGVGGRAGNTSPQRRQRHLWRGGEEQLHHSVREKYRRRGRRGETFNRTESLCLICFISHIVHVLMHQRQSVGRVLPILSIYQYGPWKAVVPQHFRLWPFKEKVMSDVPSLDCLIWIVCKGLKWWNSLRLEKTQRN